MQWARTPQSREQIVLFHERLDEVLPPDHTARLLDEILGQIDWSRWEADYHGRLGQPPIHPRVLAAVLLYGLLMRIRSSRALEDALQMRLDFRWLAEGRSIDHTTLSEFRRKHAEALKDLFVQIGLVARRLGLLSLQQLAFDGTRIKADNRRSGTRTPDQLRKMQTQLAGKYAELEARAADEDRRDEETFGPDSAGRLPAELADVRRRREQVEAALAELERAAAAGETPPSRVPLTDPEARLTPNKEGGFAPNYTPLATVDVESGLIVSADVIAATNEEEHVAAAIEDVEESFGLDCPPPEMLADGKMTSGPTLAALDEMGVTLYSPINRPDPETNPAVRDDPRQPVPAEQWDELPTNGNKSPRLDKSAFVYDAERDCYWCPAGQPLTYQHQTSEELASGRRVERHRYKSEEESCAGCPLRERCLSSDRTKRRTISRDQYESHREALSERMASSEGQEKYAKRRHAGERPFATIKQHFGARQFLLRGLESVRMEWYWLAGAFNLHRLLSLLRGSRAGPVPP